MNLSLPSLDLEAQLIISKWLILNKYATHVVWNRGCTHSFWSVHNGVLFERDTDHTANNLKALHLKVSEEHPAENVFMAFTSKKTSHAWVQFRKICLKSAKSWTAYLKKKAQYKPPMENLVKPFQLCKWKESKSPHLLLNQRVIPSRSLIAE